MNLLNSIFNILICIILMASNNQSPEPELRKQKEEISDFQDD